jgi:hypothetical protein
MMPAKFVDKINEGVSEGDITREVADIAIAFAEVLSKEPVAEFTRAIPTADESVHFRMEHQGRHGGLECWDDGWVAWLGTGLNDFDVGLFEVEDDEENLRRALAVVSAWIIGDTRPRISQDHGEQT